MTAAGQSSRPPKRRPVSAPHKGASKVHSGETRAELSVEAKAVSLPEGCDPEVGSANQTCCSVSLWVGESRSRGRRQPGQAQPVDPQLWGAGRGKEQ